MLAEPVIVDLAMKKHKSDNKQSVSVGKKREILRSEFVDCFNFMTKLVRQNPLWFSAICGGLLGLVVFAIIYGFGLVNPCNTEWLKLDFNDALNLSSDLKQHFLGWVWFRNAPWGWPLGIISSQAYPTGISVTYLDAIPLLAIPFKFIARLLPAEFQYIGLWQMICFISQGAFAAIIIRKETKNPVVVLAGSVLFIINTVFITRVFFHAALASQWLILAAIAQVLYRDRFSSKQTIIAWSVIFTLAVMIHPYFVPILAVLFFTNLVLTHGAWRETVLKITVPAVVSIIVFWTIGGFMPTNIDAGGLGFHPFDLASLFTPAGWSILSSSYLTYTDNTAYVGLGVVYTAIIAAVLTIYKTIKQEDCRNRLRVKIKQYLQPRYLLIYASFVILFVVAVSPTVKWNRQTLFVMPLPASIQAFWGIFRASTRLFWPIFYLLIVGVVFWLIKLFKSSPRALTIVFLVIVAVQIIDVGFSSNMIQEMKDVRRVQTITHSPKLDVARWMKFMQGKKHMVFTDYKVQVPQDDYILSDIATPAHLTMNDAYYARSPKSAINRTKTEAIWQLKYGKLDRDTVYVTRDQSLAYANPASTYVIHDGEFYGIIAR